MKQYTVAIVGALKKKGLFSLSRKFDSRFYQAKHNQLPITVMWIETNALGKPLCYPCVIQEGEEIMAFRTAMRAQNKALLQRWGQVISPGNKEEFLIEEMEEDTEVNLGFDKELLYKNMVDAKADWLYGLPMWDDIFDADKKKALYREAKKANTVIKGKKVGRNDPCPCGSGKKYKFCCGKNA